MFIRKFVPLSRIRYSVCDTKIVVHAYGQLKLFTATFFITATLFTTSIVFAQMRQFSLNLNSLQHKFSLTSNYLGTNGVVVKRVDLLKGEQKGLLPHVTD